MKRSAILSRAVATAAAFALTVTGFVLSAAPSGAATKAPIAIGYICSCTSPQASSVVINRSAYEAYVDYTNAHGGIDGHQIKLYLADDSANPATSSADVHTFVTQDHVQAIVSLAGSPASWQKYVDGLHIPIVGADGSPPSSSSPIRTSSFRGRLTTRCLPQLLSRQRRSAPRTSA